VRYTRGCRVYRMHWCREMRHRGMNGHATSYALNVPNWGSHLFDTLPQPRRVTALFLPISLSPSPNSLSLSFFPLFLSLCPFFSSTLVIVPRTIGARRFNDWQASMMVFPCLHAIFSLSLSPPHLREAIGAHGDVSICESAGNLHAWFPYERLAYTISDLNVAAWINENRPFAPFVSFDV